MRVFGVPGSVLINDTEFLNIDLSNVPASSIAIQCRSHVNVYITHDPLNGYWTMKAGSALIFDLGGSPIPSRTKIYAKSASGEVFLEFIVLK